MRHGLESYPGISRFALDFVHGRDSARQFFARGSASLEPLVSTPLRDAVADELLETNRQWGNDIARELDIWRRGGALTIIAGQQTGFGGGPLYTLAKLASLLNLRDRYRREGRDAVVFFWMATEDHDFLEVANLALPARDGVTLLRAAERPAPGHIVGDLPIPRTLIDQLRRHDPALAGEWCDPSLTFRDAFARLLSQTLADHGVVLVDALLPSLRRAGIDIFESTLSRWTELQELLAVRDAAIRDAGYAPQVQSEDGHTLLWLIDDAGIRNPVRIDADGALTVGQQSSSVADLRRHIAEHPQRISTGALLRPVLQDSVFGTDAFIGGPAEVSYYAQSEALHQALGVRPPAVMLRGHALVSPIRPLERALSQGFAIEELYEDPHTVLARREENAIARWDDAIAGAATRFEDEIANVTPLAADAAAEMSRSVARSMKRINYHVGRMRERGSRAIARRDADRARAVERIHEIVAPGLIPQDRRISWLPFAARWRDELLIALIEAAEPNGTTVSVIGMEG